MDKTVLEYVKVSTLRSIVKLTMESLGWEVVNRKMPAIRIGTGNSYDWTLHRIEVTDADMGIIAHEICHSLQSNKDNDKYISHTVDYDGYINQPCEKEAFIIGQFIEYIDKHKDHQLKWSMLPNKPTRSYRLRLNRLIRKFREEREVGLNRRLNSLLKKVDNALDEKEREADYVSNTMD